MQQSTCSTNIEPTTAEPLCVSCGKKAFFDEKKQKYSALCYYCSKHRPKCKKCFMRPRLVRLGKLFDYCSKECEDKGNEGQSQCISHIKN